MNAELAVDLLSIKSKTTSYYIFITLKRLFDIIVSVVGLVILLPIILCVKIAYLISGDKDSIFYTQNRIGLNGKEFKLYKFRTMVTNADELLEEILKDPLRRREYQINKKLHNDPRMTKVGKFLRETSIDELPQMLNVLKGDMAIVGNRPYLPKEKKDMGYYFDKIVETKPGITGMWQTNGRSNTTFQRRLEIESKYSDDYSMSGDFSIFLKTFKVVATRDGSKNK